jgi:hypothetical protein
MEERSQAKEHRWPLQAGKDMEIDSPLEPPEGTQPHQHLECSPVKIIWGFCLPEL